MLTARNVFALACPLITLALLLHRMEAREQKQRRITLPPPAVPALSTVASAPAASSPSELSSASLRPSSTGNGSITFWHVTDWHLNLFHKAHGDVRDMCRSEGDSAHWPGPLGHFNCDPSKEIAALAVRRMVAAQPKPAFILLGGDSFGHVPSSKENAAAVRASHDAMAELVGGAFPGVPVLPVVGNHDTWPYFAGGDAARAVRADLARLWGARLGPKASQSLSKRGYYVVRAAAEGLWLVALDTNALALGEAAATASRQLAWLETTLQSAADAAVDVIILGHIAPGASHGDWNSIAAVQWAGGCWRVAAQKRFYRAMRQHARTVRALLFGHLHSPSVRLLRAAPPGGADAAAAAAAAAAAVAMPVMYLSPSLTARNPTPHPPAVRLYELGRDGGGRWALTEAWDHSLDLDSSNARGAAAWSVGSVRDEFKLQSLSGAAWRAWLDGLRDDATFVKYHSAQRCADEVEADYGKCKGSVLCAMSELEDEPYKACLRSTRSTARPPPGWVQGVKRKP